MAQFADVQVLTSQDGTLYRVTVNASNADHTTGVGETLTQIRDSLVTAVNGTPEMVTALPTGTNRLLILPDVPTSTHFYSVNSSILLGLTVGHHGSLAVRRNLTSVLLAGLPPTGDIHPSSKVESAERVRLDFDHLVVP